MNNKFQKYKQLKDQLNIQYKGINLNRVMAIELWTFVNDKKSFSFKRIFYFFISLNLKKIKTERPILSTMGVYNRNDHTELYQNVIEKLEKQISINDLKEYNRIIRVYPNLIFKCTKDVLKRLKYTNFSFIQKMIISARFVHYANIIEDMQKVDLTNISKYLAFSGVHPLENLFTQYLSNKNIKTYSLQHGVTFLLEKDISIDALCYENFQSDILLCWGKYTVDEYHRFGISSERLLVAGYPKTSECINLKVNNAYRKCLVLCSRHIYDNANLELLNICGEIREIEFFLKLHPSLDIERYKKRVSNASNLTIIENGQTLMSLADNELFDFSIAVNTSAYYEVLAKGIPCLRYDNGVFDKMYGLNDIFTSKNQMLEILDRLKAQPLSEFQQEVNLLLNYVLGIGEDKYREILLNFEKNVNFINHD
ncbi:MULTISPECIES: hypothetical protein [unclassified Dysgonomonas]|jgi:hypothetical protein|uniref:hypothetical protein n=1 Tax=unclassified Dysgonomonas TaxID=2630389 RepID=UPI0025BE6348|nr:MULTISPECIES: hypothetical protein [unclassified Dysgonomonas]MDR2003710.1 hypothetical protein [Prevotella sp.]HMM01550.1 hypothetical protein [Dysgonomonas sp.]